jgi:hypothetical protein
MAFADARPLNLLLRWHDGVLSACLSNGHELGQIAQQMVEASRLNQLSANVWTTWHELIKPAGFNHLLGDLKPAGLISSAPTSGPPGTS